MIKDRSCTGWEHYRYHPISYIYHRFCKKKTILKQILELVGVFRAEIIRQPPVETVTQLVPKNQKSHVFEVTRAFDLHFFIK
jgi:hypothetical protein